MSRFLTPPVPVTADGSPRRVGIEMEFVGLEIEQAAAIVAECTGGEPCRKSRYRFDVTSPIGTFGVELDVRPLMVLGETTDQQRLTRSESDFPSVEMIAEEVLAALAKPVSPLEIVSPPLAQEQLPVMEAIREKLYVAGAKGTGGNLVYAFGLQLNPELASQEPAAIVTMLRALVVLYEWLKDEAARDLSRSVVRWAAPFPRAYALLLLDPRYQPDQAKMIDDYLLHNPTRNRFVDMLPLFLLLDRERVRAVVDDPLVKPRPTFHYRLPDSRVDEPGWRIADEWNRWVMVERLAADPAMLARLGRLYRTHLTDWFGSVRDSYMKRLQRWVATMEDV